MTKTNIRKLQKAQKDCIDNAELLLWGSDVDYPTMDDIAKANKLLDTAERIEYMMLKNVGVGGA